MLSARSGRNLVINHKLRISIRSTRPHSRQPLTKLCLPVAATQLVRLHRKMFLRRTLAGLSRQRSATLQLLNASLILRRLRSLSAPVFILDLRHLLNHGNWRQLSRNRLRRAHRHRLVFFPADDPPRRNNHRRWLNPSRKLQQLRRLSSLPVNQRADLPGHNRPRS